MGVRLRGSKRLKVRSRASEVEMLERLHGSVWYGRAVSDVSFFLRGGEKGRPSAEELSLQTLLVYEEPFTLLSQIAASTERRAKAT